MGDAPELFRSLQGLWMFYVVRADYRQALTLAGRLKRSAPPGDLALRMQGLYALAFTHFYLGDFAEARDRFEQAIALDDDTTSFEKVSPTGDDIRVHVLSFLGLTLWHLGAPDRGLDAGERALALARASRHPYGISWALMVTGWLHLFRGQTDRMRAHVHEAFGIASEKGFAYIRAMSGFLMSLAATLDPEAEPGAVERGIEGMQRSLHGLTAVGARLGETLMACQLLETFIRLGRLDEADGLLTTYETGAADREEQAWAAEFRRLSGVLHLRRALDNGADASHSLALAEAAFREAIAISDGQGATGLRLRATRGLAQTLDHDGRSSEAAALLGEIVGLFSEGATTADVAEAREMLRSVT